MLAQRSKEYGYTKLVLVPRLPELMALEGWYPLEVPKTPLYREYESSGTKLKYSQWLLRVKGYSESYVAFTVKVMKEHPTALKLSCRFNDILRVSSTPHYSSCIAPGHGLWKVPARMCQDPRVCVAYVPDSAGHFKGRTILVLTAPKTMQALRPYGMLDYEHVDVFVKRLGYTLMPAYEDASMYPYQKKGRNVMTRRTQM